MTELDILRHIRDEYGTMIGISAAMWGHRAEVLAGIMCRESAGGITLTPPGPGGTGDSGHGHGLMQIDDRSFSEFCSSDVWQDARANIDFGAKVLREKRLYITTHTTLLDPAMVERCAIAGYNCGAARVVQALNAGSDPDWYTTGRNYSREVLRMAEAYRSMLRVETDAVIPDTQAKRMTLFQRYKRLLNFLKGAHG